MYAYRLTIKANFRRLSSTTSSSTLSFIFIFTHIQCALFCYMISWQACRTTEKNTSPFFVLKVKLERVFSNSHLTACLYKLVYKKVRFTAAFAHDTVNLFSEIHKHRVGKMMRVKLYNK